MEDHNFILLKISRLFPSSLTSCQFRRTSPDVAQSSVSIPKTNKFILHQNNLSPSLKKPEKIPQFKNPKQSKKYQLLGTISDTEGPNCPPFAKPISNPNPNKLMMNPTCSSSNSGYWFSSGPESSNSGESFRRRRTRRRFRRCEEMKSIDEMGYDQISTQIYYSNSSSTDSGTSFRRRKTGSKDRRRRKMKKSKSAAIEESYAVEKSSSDPYSDFRASMVEMIVEKQMFGEEDLKRLLYSFLSLNAASYHGVIVEVFSEICETLFSN